MPMYWCIRFAQQDEISSRSIFLLFCGGKCPVAGASRPWPLSREQYPKQLLALTDGETLL